VEVHDANGTLIGSAIANADGSFSIELNPAQANGELLDVVAIDDSGVSSLPAQVTAPDITAPAARPNWLSAPTVRCSPAVPNPAAPYVSWQPMALNWALPWSARPACSAST
jgi:hypothetical protein